MAVSAADVKRLRELTQAGMMDCKKALEEADGDFELSTSWPLTGVRGATAHTVKNVGFTMV